MTKHTNIDHLTFRYLRPDEVEIRPAEVRNNKTTLLLYQDARCAMNILDETVGSLGWQKEYYEAKGLLMCKIGIFSDGAWLWKSDTGSESNIEADKGLASDAFKRAAVSWGIARELYTAPRVVVQLGESDLYNGKLAQTFSVKEMDVENGTITKLVITDRRGVERFRWPYSQTEPVAQPQQAPRQKKKQEITLEMMGDSITINSLLGWVFKRYEESKYNPSFSVETLLRANYEVGDKAMKYFLEIYEPYKNGKMTPIMR